MKTFIADIIPKLQRYSQKLDNITLLTNQHWVVVDEIANSKTVYIFRSNNELLISKNGEVEKAKWEYLGNNSLLLDLKDKSYLFRHGFFDENLLALKIDGKEEYALLVNESRFDSELNSYERILVFLKTNYLDQRQLTGVGIPYLQQNPSYKRKLTDVTNENIVEFLNGSWVGVDMGNTTIRYYFTFNGNNLYRSSNYNSIFKISEVQFTHFLDGRNDIVLTFKELKSTISSKIQILNQDELSIDGIKFSRT
jgi:hypothetical protein